MVKKILILVSALIVALLIAGLIFVYNTKSHSPETDVSFESGDLRITVFYNRPYKKGRMIFGGLVPYGQTWRTGANEATTFETNKDLLIGTTILKKGKYSLWTVPDPQKWAVVFNKTIPPWGIDVMNNSVAARTPIDDVLIIDAPVVATQREFEQFTISLEETDGMIELVLAWDKTLVAVPMSVNVP